MAETGGMMGVISLENSISSDIQNQVLDILRNIEQTNEVTILFAVESGSRAWGFPSPDSDYDVRFIYVHKRDWYLQLQDKRDVIELPISEELDVSGWDLQKALRLLLKPNPVMLEWLSSPIRYLWNEELARPIVDLGQQVDGYVTSLYHYQHLARSQNLKHLEGRDEVKLKKYFYILRPAMALRWLRLNGSTPPMNMQELMAGCDLTTSETEQINIMIATKMKTKEMGDGPRVGIIDAIIDSELAWAQAQKTAKIRHSLTDKANQCFLEILKATNT